MAPVPGSGQGLFILFEGTGSGVRAWFTPVRGMNHGLYRLF